MGRRPACLADRRGRLRVLRLFGRRLPGLLSTAAFYVVLLSMGYMVSRGLAKSGSRHHDDA